MIHLTDNGVTALCGKRPGTDSITPNSAIGATDTFLANICQTCRRISNYERIAALPESSEKRELQDLVMADYHRRVLEWLKKSRSRRI